MRDDRIIIRMTPEEKKMVAVNAAALGLNTSAYIRYLIAQESQKIVQSPIDTKSEV